MIHQWDIAAEPRGATLRLLLASALPWCDEFLFARTDMKLSEHGLSIVAALKEFRLACEDVSAYPAAVLEDYTVTVCRHRFNHRTLEILANAADGLYDWQEPYLPNDLCLMRGSDPWLVTMAADREASILATDEELSSLVAQVPGLYFRSRLS